MASSYEGGQGGGSGEALLVVVVLGPGPGPGPAGRYAGKMAVVAVSIDDCLAMYE